MLNRIRSLRPPPPFSTIPATRPATPARVTPGLPARLWPDRTFTGKLVSAFPTHPASGSPTGFTARHTADGHFRLVSPDDTVALINLRLSAELPRKPSDTFWCYQAHRQSPVLSFFESAPEVRVLSSAGITRPHRSYHPVRLPPLAVLATASEARPPTETGLPRLPGPPSQRAVPIPPVDQSVGACVGCFPSPRGLPRQTGGSASTISLSRPAQASLALRPAGSLDRPRRPLSRGFETASYPTAPLVSYQINRQLSVKHLPPLVFRTANPSPAAAPSMSDHKSSIGVRNSATGRATSCSSAPSAALDG